jgi:phenylalanyl-tRNA synthetase alpha chain
MAAPADLSRAEKRLLAALPGDGSPVAARELGLASEGEALRTASGPERHGLVAVTQATRRRYVVSDEGHAYVAKGLPERRALAAIARAKYGVSVPALASAAGLDAARAKLAVGWLRRKGWATIEDGVLRAAAKKAPKRGPDEALLAALAGNGAGDATDRGERRATMDGDERGAATDGDEGDDTPDDGTGAHDDGAHAHHAGGAAHDDADVLAQLVQRGLVVAHDETTRHLALTPAGQKFVQTLDIDALGEEVNQVTPGFVARWATMDDAARAAVHLRAFDFDVDVEPRHPGKTHPLTQFMQQIRDVFWRMGFAEISGDYVESAFWNMDALFIPQDHPAREEHDTFYLDEPATVDVAEADLERGRFVHEEGGGTGSTGWGGAWSADIARQGLLRTHTTNTTIRHLAADPTSHHRVFGLGRVFRNETMDATHLPEFHQIEGIVTEPEADFDMLIGLCKVFFAAIGFSEVRFRPAYFPYTEPSMEIDVFYHGRWMELGGCGVFRPEVTEPLGVAHPVLAWGFGLERLAMMRLGLADIRDLYLSDVQWLKEQPQR